MDSSSVPDPGLSVGDRRASGSSSPEEQRTRRSGAGRRWWSVVALVLVVGLLVVLVMYRRQAWSYATHWKGGPASTTAYVPHSPPPDVHLAAVGDVGDSGRNLTAVADAMNRIGRNEPYDALMVLGDNSYPEGEPAKLDQTVFEPFAPVLRGGAELLGILGNHDVMENHGSAQLQRMGMEGPYWERRIGEVQIVGLDSNDPRNPAQLDFLERVLSTSTARWKIVLLHHPPYSAGYQGSNTTVRQVFTPVFRRYGVQLVISGHDHDYQRSNSIDGVTYVVSGGGSGSRRTGSADFTARSFSWIHFVDLAVYEDRLVLRSVGADGRVGEEHTIRAGG